MVAQIDEEHAAMVADTMAPPRQANGLVDMAVAERAAGVRPVAMHGYPGNTSEGGIGIAIKREAQGLPDRIRRGNQSSAIRSPEFAGRDCITGGLRPMNFGRPFPNAIERSENLPQRGNYMIAHAITIYLGSSTIGTGYVTSVFQHQIQLLKAVFVSKFTER
ncbi:hypothetical protein [Tardiphaga sp. 619_E2_N8_5]|uniref:hypothetical protein n=1 Tax=unclassified Tardiphaga TaxID=2631404 RepID=UPI003F23B514